MHYDSYEAEDFASDPAFVQWVRQPNAELDAFWQSWLDQHPEKGDTLTEARRLVNFLRFRTNQPLPEEQVEVKQKILEQIAKSELPINQPAQQPFRWLTMAASVALLLVGIAALWYYFLSPSYIYYSTDYSEQLEIILPDSTQVKLNANSELKVKSGWSDITAREVWLEGEAYFKVIKKPAAADGRFIVHAQKLDVEVMGTEFNVQARRGKTEVVLNEGKVELRRQDHEKSMMMEPGDKASLGEDQVLTKIKVNPDRYASWKDERLFFDNTSLREIFIRIKDIHGYQIEVSDPEILQQKFTGSCPINDISILITALSETFNLTAEQEGKQIIFRHQ